MRWPAKVACGKMSCPHLTAKRASQDQPHLAATSKNRAFCDANTTSDNFFRSLRLAAPQLSQSFFTKSGVYTGPGADAQWLGSQIPDTAPYIEWLAIVCSVMAVLALHSPILTWRPNLRVLRAGGVKALRQLALDREKIALAFPQ